MDSLQKFLVTLLKLIPWVFFFCMFVLLIVIPYIICSVLRHHHRKLMDGPY